MNSRNPSPWRVWRRLRPAARGPISAVPGAVSAVSAVFHFARFRSTKGVEIIFVRPKMPETGQMSAVQTGQMSAAETGKMSSPVSIVEICVVSTADICPVSAADICPVSTADICPVSTEDIYPVSTEDIGRRPVAVSSSVETG